MDCTSKRCMLGPDALLEDRLRWAKSKVRKRTNRARLKITWFELQSRPQNQRRCVTGPTQLPGFFKWASLARLRIHRGWPEITLKRSQESLQLWCGICTSSLGQGPQHCMCAPLGQFTAPHRLALCEPRQEEDTLSSPIAKFFLPLNPQVGYYLHR